MNPKLLFLKQFRNFGAVLSHGLFLLFVLLLCSHASVSAAEQSADERITLRVRNMSIPEIFKRIEQSSDYRFFYRDEQLRGLGRRSIQVKNASLESVMDRLLEGTSLTYKIDSRHIVLYGL